MSAWNTPWVFNGGTVARLEDYMPPPPPMKVDGIRARAKQGVRIWGDEVLDLCDEIDRLRQRDDRRLKEKIIWAVENDCPQVARLLLERLEERVR